ncbi:MAG: hypothetical protein H0X39_18405 [Actinobacteria bacterium]|nr:hypothetical protein [Actinomycetota bacterium]
MQQQTQQKLEIKTFQFLMQAVTPIHHGHETFGNISTVMRRKTRMPDGSWASIPAISGDAMRHGLREAGAYAFLSAAGMLSDPALSEATLRLLFAGGMVTGKGDAGGVKLDKYRELCEMIPTMSILGGCASNRIVPGQLVVEDLMLVCKESEHITPKWIVDEAGTLDTCRAHVELEQRVRMDPTLSPEKLKLLSAGAATDVQHRLLQSEHAHADDVATAKEATKSSMMPRQNEVVCAGSMFSWSVTARCYSDLEVDVFNTLVASFLADARVGGKRGTGHGALRAVKAQGVILTQAADRLHPLDTTALAPKVGELFRTHVQARASKLREYLKTVDA